MGKDLIIETIVKDENGRRLDRQLCMRSDYPKVIRILNLK